MPSDLSGCKGNYPAGVDARSFDEPTTAELMEPDLCADELSPAALIEETIGLPGRAVEVPCARAVCRFDFENDEQFNAAFWAAEQIFRTEARRR
jgi:hypothetical protein